MNQSLDDLIEIADAADTTLALARIQRDATARLRAAGCIGSTSWLNSNCAWLDGAFTARQLRIIADVLDQMAGVG